MNIVKRHTTNIFTTIVFVMVLMGSISNSVYASSNESLNNLRNAVQSFLTEYFAGSHHIKFSVGQLDKRLRLTRCGQKMEAFIPDSARLLGYTTIGLRCGNPQQWSIHVPVTISHYKQVLVTNRNLPRGHQISPADTMTKKMDISRLPQGFFENPEQLSGLVLKRSILRGQQINPGMLGKARLVQRGQTITILAKTGGIAIRTRGKALMDGRQGELIKVKNSNTNRELRGVVISKGVVQLNL